MSGECYWLSVCYSSPSSVSRLYTSLRRWKFWIVVWENTNGVHFRAVWKNRAHVQRIRCSPKGSHLIPWTTAVFSNTTLKWTPLAYHTELLRDVHPMLFWCWASFVDLPSTIHSKHKTFPSFVSMLAKRLRRWPTIETTLGRCRSGFWGRADHCPPSFFSSHLAFSRDIAGRSFVVSFWVRHLRPTQYSLGEIGAKLHRFWDRSYSWQKNGKVSIEAVPKPGKVHLQAAASPCSEWRPRWEIIIGRVQATGCL